ncbi:hypothetical protein B0H11DRAFT_2203523 [Mycena galericulata]|nr:hypothetical protein B0H11DRAFT_2203523 [Mycena galericulata]
MEHVHQESRVKQRPSSLLLVGLMLCGCESPVAEPYHTYFIFPEVYIKPVLEPTAKIVHGIFFAAKPVLALKSIPARDHQSSRRAVWSGLLLVSPFFRNLLNSGAHDTILAACGASRHRSLQPQWYIQNATRLGRGLPVICKEALGPLGQPQARQYPTRPPRAVRAASTAQPAVQMWHQRPVSWPRNRQGSKQNGRVTTVGVGRPPQCCPPGHTHRGVQESPAPLRAGPRMRVTRNAAPVLLRKTMVPKAALKDHGNGGPSSCTRHCKIWSGGVGGRRTQLQNKQPHDDGTLDEWMVRET